VVVGGNVISDINSSGGKSADVENASEDRRPHPFDIPRMICIPVRKGDAG